MPQGNHLSNGHGTALSDPSDSTIHSLRIIVVGAGLGGLAAAISCSLSGHKVLILEGATQLGEVGAGIQLTPNVTRLLRRWGLFESLAPVAVQPHNIWFRRWQTGEPIGVTKLVPDFEQHFAAPYWVVHRAHLHEALVQRATQLGVEIRVASRVIGANFDQGTLKTADGASYSGDLILGCDGLKSVTRSVLLQDQNPGPRPTPYCAYRSTVSMDLLRNDPDLVELFAKPDLSLWVGDQRHVMTYPINGGETFNMVLSHPEDRTEDTLVTNEELLNEMRNNYQGWDPRLTKIIALIDKTTKWKLMACPRIETWRHSSGKFVLLGDACHAMLPYMSQGAAQAIEDAAAIGRCVACCTNANAVPFLTAKYEEIRKERAYKVQHLSYLNGRIWHYPDGEDQQERDKGMAATLTGEHYIRSTNQWSDPSTQIWLYSHDAEAAADECLDGVCKESAKKTKNGAEDMTAAGLLAPRES